jgi:formylglycine-generating enzyme required for sulfatase activity
MLLLASFTGSRANNIQVTNTQLLSEAGGTVQFDLSWENSWRGGPVTNWDAAWVFVKYRLGNFTWGHAHLTAVGHTAPSGTLIEVGMLDPGATYQAMTNPGMGAFIRRSVDGHGAFSATGIKLNISLAIPGINFADINAIQVFAVEMVYVPQGAFHVGSGGTETGSFTAGPWTSGATTPFQVTSEGALNIGNSAGQLWGTSSAGSSTIGTAGTLPLAYPKGFAGYYAMKYEISQQQYVDFLNTLARTQQNTRTATDLSPNITSVTSVFVMGNGANIGMRNGIRCNSSIAANAPIQFYCDLDTDGVGGETNDGQWIACNFLSYGDVAAYLDWSGLRPMSELEFEKACRGPLSPVANEYAWGTDAVTSGTTFSLSNSGMANETLVAGYSTAPATGNGNFGFNAGIVGYPMRVGLFSGHVSNTGRTTAGATYWGLMEMSGNVSEYAVNVGSTQGRAFTGTHGNGALNATGSHDLADWPTTTAGFGFRGGAINSAQTTVSSRDVAVQTNDGRLTLSGGRGVRRAP